MTVQNESLNAPRFSPSNENPPAAISVQEVISRYHSALITFLRRRLRVADDAHDVAQETYIRMMKYEGATDIRSASSVLFRIASNVAFDLERAGRARHVNDHFPIDDIDLVSDQPSIEQILTGEQRFNLAYAAIDALPPRCKQVFLLSRVNGMTYPQIAAHCGISVKMVEKHISHALATCLRKVGDDS